MSGYVLFDTASGEARSIGTGTPTAPADMTLTLLSDAQYETVRRGDMQWSAATRALVPNPDRAASANGEAIKPLLVNALARLDQIIAVAPITVANVAALNNLLQAVQDEARMLRRLIRLQTDTLDGVD